MFFVDNFLTFLDVGVYINEWVQALFDNDPDKMIEINKKIAVLVGDFFVEAVLYVVDKKLGLGGTLPLLWTCLKE
ncbi:MAG: hypothetical protein E7247_12875 [Paenibacillaceae bacterium]|nr:hypothetical protein [Paenibacillaceae bacterium]